VKLGDDRISNSYLVFYLKTFNVTFDIFNNFMNVTFYVKYIYQLVLVEILTNFNFNVMWLCNFRALPNILITKFLYT